MRASSTRRAIVALGAGRVGFGALMSLAPARALAALRHPPESLSPAALLMARMYGVRDVALGVFTLGARHDSRLASAALLTTAAIDAGDSLALATLLPAPASRQLALGGLALSLPTAAFCLWLRGRPLDDRAATDRSRG